MFDDRAPTPTRTRTGIVAEIAADRQRATLLLSDGLLEEVALAEPLASRLALGQPVEAFYDDSENLLGWQIRADGPHGVDYR